MSNLDTKTVVAVICGLSLGQSQALQAKPFYVAGLRQGMTTTEYNSLIANGRYISKPAFEGTFIATIDGRSYFATFCNSRLEKVLAEYSAGEWLAKMAEFVKEGYEFTQVFINENYDGLGRVKQLAFSVKGKAGMDYMVWPTINQNHYDGGAGAAHTVAYIDSKTTCKLGT